MLWWQIGFASLVVLVLLVQSVQVWAFSGGLVVCCGAVIASCRRFSRTAMVHLYYDGTDWHFLEGDQKIALQLKQRQFVTRWLVIIYFSKLPDGRAAIFIPADSLSLQQLRARLLR